MSLKQALFETIYEQWGQQGWNELSYLTTVYIHPSLAKAIENEGYEMPKVFDPNKFSMNEDSNYFEIEIQVKEQDGLIYYEYE